MQCFLLLTFIAFYFSHRDKLLIALGNKWLALLIQSRLAWLGGMVSVTSHTFVRQFYSWVGFYLSSTPCLSLGKCFQRCYLICTQSNDSLFYLPEDILLPGENSGPLAVPSPIKVSFLKQMSIVLICCLYFNDPWHPGEAILASR